MLPPDGRPAARPVPTVSTFGDSAVLIDLGLAAGPDTSRMVRLLADRLGSTAVLRHLRGPVVVGASRLLIPVDPIQPGAVAAASSIEAALADLAASIHSDARPADGPVLEIPVRYGGALGPDLGKVAHRTGLTPDEVVRLHASTGYTAAFAGFAPGFAYLEPLPTQLRLPRLDQPRTRVPAGSVAIAGPYTAVYPTDSPGGWWIIGRTDLALWDPRRDPPALVRPGTRIRFVQA